jgi:hypothetical protein
MTEGYLTTAFLIANAAQVLITFRMAVVHYSYGSCISAIRWPTARQIRMSVCQEEMGILVDGLV